MIRNVLIALDAASDASVATRYATDIARRCDASVTSRAVTDPGQMEMDTSRIGTTTLHQAERFQKKLTPEAHQTAHHLTKTFRHTLDNSARLGSKTETGVPFRRIIEDAKYHDLLIVGHDPHFFYNRPKQRMKALAKVVKESVAPTFVVRDQYVPIERVVIAHDGNNASARTLRYFAQLQPFGTDIEIELLGVYEKDQSDAKLALQMAARYLQDYDFSAQTTTLQGATPHEDIVAYVNQFDADVVVAGAHSTSPEKQLAFGSTATSLLKQSTASLFIHY